MCCLRNCSLLSSLDREKCLRAQGAVDPKFYPASALLHFSTATSRLTKRRKLHNQPANRWLKANQTEIYCAMHGMEWNDGWRNDSRWFMSCKHAENSEYLGRVWHDQCRSSTVKWISVEKNETWQKSCNCWIHSTRRNWEIYRVYCLFDEFIDPVLNIRVNQRVDRVRGFRELMKFLLRLGGRLKAERNFSPTSSSDSNFIEDVDV